MSKNGVHLHRVSDATFPIRTIFCASVPRGMDVTAAIWNVTVDRIVLPFCSVQEQLAESGIVLNRKRGGGLSQEGLNSQRWRNNVVLKPFIITFITKSDRKSTRLNSSHL